MPYAYVKKKRKTRRPIKRRQTFKKRRYRASIPRSLAKKDFFSTKFHLEADQQTIWTLVNGGTGSINQQSLVFYARHFKGFRDLSRHFEAYKINLIVMKWIPVMTEISNRELTDTSVAQIQSAVPDVYYLIDRDDNIVPTGTPSQILDFYRGNRRTVVKKATKPHTIKFKPSLLVPAYKSGAATGAPDDWTYSTQYNRWIRLNQGATSTEVSMFCLKMAIEDSIQGQFVLRPDITCYASFMKRRPL